MTTKDEQAQIDAWLAENGVTECPGYGEGPLPHYDNMKTFNNARQRFYEERSKKANSKYTPRKVI
jgi:hypothetical protein